MRVLEPLSLVFLKASKIIDLGSLISLLDLYYFLNSLTTLIKLLISNSLAIN
jgi:hypothetical protein